MRRAVAYEDDGLAVEVKQNEILYFDKDESGRTFVERWFADGAGGLREDERLYLSLMNSNLRMALIEVGTIAKDRLVQAWDLLDSPVRELRICDRYLASSARRFDAESADEANQQEWKQLSAIVPPGLRPKRRELAIESSRIEIPPGQTMEEVEFAHRQMLLRDLLTKPVPMFGNKRAKEAAADPRLRPLVVHWLKGQVQAWDRFILETGLSGDINWLVREIGIPELDVPAPPPRKRVGFDSE